MRITSDGIHKILVVNIGFILSCFRMFSLGSIKNMLSPASNSSSYSSSIIDILSLIKSLFLLFTILKVIEVLLYSLILSVKKSLKKDKMPTQVTPQDFRNKTLTYAVFKNQQQYQTYQLRQLQISPPQDPQPISSEPIYRGNSLDKETHDILQQLNEYRGTELELKGRQGVDDLTDCTSQPNSRHTQKNQRHFDKQIIIAVNTKMNGMATEVSFELIINNLIIKQINELEWKSRQKQLLHKNRSM